MVLKKEEICYFYIFKKMKEGFNYQIIFERNDFVMQFVIYLYFVVLWLIFREEVMN